MTGTKTIRGSVYCELCFQEPDHFRRICDCCGRAVCNACSDDSTCGVCLIEDSDDVAPTDTEGPKEDSYLKEIRENVVGWTVIEILPGRRPESPYIFSLKRRGATKQIHLHATDLGMWITKDD